MKLIVKQISAILLLALLACNLGPSSISAADKPKQLKLATLAPEGSIWLEQMTELNKELKLTTGDGIKFKVYPGGIMGDDDVVLRKMRVGQLDGAIFTTGALAQIDPNMYTLAFPGLFNSYQEVDTVLANHYDTISASIEEKGYQILGIMSLGFTYMFTQNPVTTPEDLRSCKAWLWDNDVIMKEVYSNIGTTPVSVGISDVMTALQTGLIDTVFNTPTGILSMQWFTRTKRMLDLPLTSSFGVLLVSNKAWKKVPEDLKPKVAEIVKKHAHEITRKTREKDEQARIILQDRGIIIDKPSEAVQKQLELVCENSVKNLLSNTVDPSLYRLLSADVSSGSKK